MYFDEKQFICFFAIFCCLVLILIIPSIIPFQSVSQKQVTMEQNNIKSQSMTVTTIFNNNLLIAGVTLIPYVGWGWIIYVMWNTGTVVASYCQPWYWLLLNPFMYVELVVDAYVVLKSIRLVQLFKRRKTRFMDLDGKEVVRKTTGVWPEIVKTVAYTFIVSSLVLLGSALLEFMFMRGLL